MIEHYKKYEPLFGEWKISKLIGKGSFGEVYEIERDNFGIKYKAALKAISIPVDESELNELMSSGMSVAETKQYIKQSAKDIVNEFVLMSKLKGNTNIVSYEDHQVIEHEDQLGWDILMKMELLQPINEYIKINGFTEKDLIKLGIDLCTAIELCEKHHIVHRDIKPENIFVSPNGDFKLGDFGIARSIEKTTLGLSKKGTYSYMAPEVYKGEHYTEKVDIYSLGIVMYKLMNYNRVPFMPKYPNPVAFSDREQALIRRMNGEKLPAPSCIEEGKIVEIALKACEYDAKQRYENATKMKQDLESLLGNGSERILLSPAKKTTGLNNQDEKAKVQKDKKAIKNEKGQKNEKVIQSKSVPKSKSALEDKVEDEEIEKTLLLDREEITHSHIENRVLEGAKKSKIKVVGLACTCIVGLIIAGGLAFTAYSHTGENNEADQLQNLSSANFMTYSKMMLEDIQKAEEPKTTAEAIPEAAIEGIIQANSPKEEDKTKEEQEAAAKEAAEKEAAQKAAELAKKAEQEKAQTQAAQKEQTTQKESQSSLQTSPKNTVKENTKTSTKETPKAAETTKKQSTTQSNTQSQTPSNESAANTKQQQSSQTPAASDAPPEIYLDFN